MARKIVYTCDVCGAVKKETNNWFDVFVQVDSDKQEHLEIHHFDSLAEDQHYTVCGERCGIRLMSRWMQTGSLEDSTSGLDEDAILGSAQELSDIRQKITVRGGIITDIDGHKVSDGRQSL